MDKYGFQVLYLELVSLKGHILTTVTIMFKLSSMFENSVTEVDEAETLKFLSILTELRSYRWGKTQARRGRCMPLLITLL